MIAHDASIGDRKNLPSEEHLPSYPQQRLVISPFNFLNGTGWLSFPATDVTAHSAELLFNLQLPGKSPEVCQFIRRLGKRYPNCSVTVLNGKGLSTAAKKAHVRLVTKHSLHTLKCPHFLYYEDNAHRSKDLG
jgi:hypothetical protein